MSDAEMPPPRRLRVAVLMGGPSRERNVSLASGEAVAKALGRAGFAVLPVRIETNRTWSLLGGDGSSARLSCESGSEGASADATRGEDERHALGLPAARAVTQIHHGAGDGIDAVFIALHGAFGEDGTVQGFLETMGIAYTGSGVAASAFAMDKERAKEILSRHGIATAPWITHTRASWLSAGGAALDDVIARTGLPAVVKMPREGSSFGVTMVSTPGELEAAILQAVEDAEGRALIERRIEGVEVTCPVLGNRGGSLRTLPLVEIVPKGRGFFDFQAKYEGASDEICPARVNETVAARVREAAMTAHRVLGCDGITRSDFIVPASGEPIYLETNTVPGMTAQSLVPLSARTAGISYESLCVMLVELAVESAARRAT